MTLPTIEKNKPFTVIIELEVEPERQEELPTAFTVLAQNQSTPDDLAYPIAL